MLQSISIPGLIILILIVILIIWFVRKLMASLRR